MKQQMIYAMKERLGDPSLFCGRTQQMGLLMNWVEMIPREMAKSRALLGRRKSGKTAIMQRLFNILWNQNGSVIPFYFEILDYNQCLLDFTANYYRTFMSQYLSFKTRTVLPVNNQPWQFSELIDIAKEIGDDHALRHIDGFQTDYESKRANDALLFAFGAPAEFAGLKNTFFLVMVDEIQLMTKYIFYDQEQKVQAYNLPGAYYALVESKVAPMLVSGSYVGWMTRMMREIFKGGRLKRTPISSKLTFDEGLEAVYRYAEFNQVTITDETALIINQLTQSDPFYIASLFRSDWTERDFTTLEGTINTLTYEIKNQEGELFGTWSEYIDATIREVNDRHAKQILLFLSQNRHQECTRTEISDHLGGELSDRKLEERLSALHYGDLITKGVSNFRYSGIPDDILDLIFRELYQEEIGQQKPDIAADLAAKVKALEAEKKSLQGRLGELKGRMLELVVYRELNQCRKAGQPINRFQQRLRPFLNAETAEKFTKLQAACGESRFERVWMNYLVQVPQTTAVEVDVLAEGEADDSCWALVFETKNRDETRLPTQQEAQLFVATVDKVKQWLARKGKTIRFIGPVYLSAAGFDSDVEAWLHERGVLTADLASWVQ